MVGVETPTIDAMIRWNQVKGRAHCLLRSVEEGMAMVCRSGVPMGWRVGGRDPRSTQHTRPASCAPPSDANHR